MSPFFIKDKRGRRYEVVCEFHAPNLFYEVMEGRLCVGSLRGYFDDELTLRILEVIMYDERKLPKRRWWNLWRLLCFGRKWSYRRRGLGSALMNLIITHARECGFQKIVATLVPLHGIEGEWLLLWFKRLGFEIMPPDKTRTPSSIAEVVLSL